MATGTGAELPASFSGSLSTTSLCRWGEAPVATGHMAGRIQVLSPKEPGNDVEELQVVGTCYTRIFQLKVFDFNSFQDVQFITEIFPLLEPKLSYHFHSDKKCPEFLGKQ